MIQIIIGSLMFFFAAMFLGAMFWEDKESTLMYLLLGSITFAYLAIAAGLMYWGIAQ